MKHVKDLSQLGPHLVHVRLLIVLLSDFITRYALEETKEIKKRAQCCCNDEKGYLRMCKLIFLSSICHSR